MNESDEIYTVNALLTFACTAGYQILPAGDNKVVCDEAGSWESEVGECYTGGIYVLITKRMLNKQK